MNMNTETQKLRKINGRKQQIKCKRQNEKYNAAPQAEVVCLIIMEQKMDGGETSTRFTFDGHSNAGAAHLPGRCVNGCRHVNTCVC